MALSYKFSLIQARPDPQRAERVNVGIVVGGDEIDVRLPEIRKLKPLTGHGWDDVAKAFSENLTRVGAGIGDLDKVRDNAWSRSEVFLLGQTGTFVAGTKDEYESRIRSILKHFVLRPRLSKTEKIEKINSEISRVLKTAGIFGQQGDPLNDGRVVPRFVVSAEKDMVADFAYQSDRLKIVTTLELRGTKAAHGKACEKGATLYFAKQKFGADMRPFAVFAANPADLDDHKSEIEILRGFSDGNVFNWSNVHDRERFQSALY